MAFTYAGLIDATASYENDGHRNYELVFRVISSTKNDLGAQASVTAGLPVVGASYSIGNDSDTWAYCLPGWKCRREFKDPGKPNHWLVTVPYSTKPLSRCQTTSIENPLLEPPKISGSFVKYTKQLHEDRNGDPYRSSTGEPLVGKETEVDDDRLQVVISQNQSAHNLSTVDSLMNKLNNATLWGLSSEKVKLSGCRFEQRWYAVCTEYWNFTYEFDIRDSWTQELADKGRMKLSTGGTATNPDHWEVAKDRFGENLPVMRLDTNGQPIVTDTQTPATISREPYSTGNLLLLGIPSSF